VGGNREQKEEKEFPMKETDSWPPESSGKKKKRKRTKKKGNKQATRAGRKAKKLIPEPRTSRKLA